MMWSDALDISGLLTPSFYSDFIHHQLQQHPFHLLVELLFLLLIAYLYLRRPYDPVTTQLKLTSAEEEDLIRSWTPDSLTPLSADSLRPEAPVISDQDGPRVRLASTAEWMTAYTSTNFLGLTANTEVRDAARETIERYGVGSCGPRGFYGTFDQHLTVERAIASFYQAPACILYSDASACITSVIPAFSKRGDLIVCDSAANYPIQQGIRLSRSNVLYYNHNDMDDLERVLMTVLEQDMTRPTKLNRRFIVCEGISTRHGDIAPLDKIVALKHKYKYRVILDDSLAIGVLGKTGRGTAEYFNVDTKQIDLLCGALDTTCGSMGGYCVGSAKVVDHQRLSGAGYCFSASSPPYTAAAATVAIHIIEKSPHLTQLIRDKAERCRRALMQLNGATVVGGVCPSPVIHIRLRSDRRDRAATEALLLRVAAIVQQDKVLVSVPEYTPTERTVEPSLAVFVTTMHSDQDIDIATKTIKNAFDTALNELR